MPFLPLANCISSSRHLLHLVSNAEINFLETSFEQVFPSSSKIEAPNLYKLQHKYSFEIPFLQNNQIMETHFVYSYNFANDTVIHLCQSKDTTAEYRLLSFAESKILQKL